MPLMAHRRKVQSTLLPLNRRTRAHVYPLIVSNRSSLPANARKPPEGSEPRATLGKGDPLLQFGSAAWLELIRHHHVRTALLGSIKGAAAVWQHGVGGAK